MPIQFSKDQQLFQLDTQSTSYVMMVKQGYLQHLYWGPRLNVGDHSYMCRDASRPSFQANDEYGSANCSLDSARLEYPAFGRGDLRTPAIEIQNADGSDLVDLKYRSHQIYAGKPQPAGLPATYCEDSTECTTLEILLRDDISCVEVQLFYCVFEQLGALCRFARITNNGSNNIRIQRALSACVDFDRCDMDMVSNHGAWARERNIEVKPLFQGKQEIYSRRGASSHAHNPFLIVKDHQTTEYAGNAYGMVLIYSGNFEAFADVDGFRQTRMAIGLNHDSFEWTLKPSESFDTPEAALVHSAEGLTPLSNAFHKLFRERLCRGKYRDCRRPVLLNIWEAVYFGFDEDKVESIAKEAGRLGVELLVVDDGWFGKRDSDNCSLGDWTPDPRKLPGGIQQLAKKINACGCKLGIWFEPEMISPDSDLYRKHPEWVLRAEKWPVSKARSQYMLDMSRQDVQDYLYDCISKVITDGNIEYIKWDFNRNMAEVGSRLLTADQQGEVAHRYYLGLYSLLERLVTNYPGVLFESCSGGGGRFDAGLLYYMPQAWTSDNTDAMKRLAIQYGSSFVYPSSSMSAHVSICPNHQTGTISPFRTRMDVALTGSFGFELNPLELSEEEKKVFAEAAKLYCELGDLLVNGRYIRLVSPLESNYAAWAYVSEDERELFVVAVNQICEVNGALQRFCVHSLKEKNIYCDTERHTRYSTQELTHYGLQIPQDMRERESMHWHLIAE